MRATAKIGRDAMRVAAATKDRQAQDGLMSSLSSAVFGTLAEAAYIWPFGSRPLVADATSKVLVRSRSGAAIAVVLCSNASAPNAVQRAMHRARQAKEELSEPLGQPILTPIAEGRVLGRSYAILPYCRPLSQSRLYWPVQRRMLSTYLLNWLCSVASQTAHSMERAGLSQFNSALKALKDLNGTPERTRKAADWALHRLETGDWKPRAVLMHGDLWKGNVLLQPAARRRSAGRMAIIDWAGSDVDGYAIYDLVRLAESFRISTGSLRREIRRHCAVLNCEICDAESYLLAALGHIAGRLEHFPPRRFLQMAEACMATLEAAKP